MTNVKERYNRSSVLQSKPWSEHQLAVFDAVKNTDRHILVEAVAGGDRIKLAWNLVQKIGTELMVDRVAPP